MQRHLFLKGVKPEIHDFWIDKLDPNESITDLSPNELIDKYAEKEHTSGGYTGGRGFSRGGSQRGRGYYPWKGGRGLDGSNCHSKINAIGLISDRGVEERRPLNRMANSALAMFLMRMGNIEVWGVFNTAVEILVVEVDV
jgi:hypothetical protein